MTAVELPADLEAHTLDPDRTALIGVASNQEWHGPDGQVVQPPAQNSVWPSLRDD
ncbi:MAG TPA: hypothetical protein VN965_10640 [Candidatus Dormibacteraeota bacterium]|nr:hypothetical protein [Candidatus Dormibacteraeota bacterium]